MSLENEIEKIVDRKLEEHESNMQPTDYRPWIFTSDVAEIIGYTEEWVIKKYTTKSIYIKKKLIKKDGGKWIYKHPEFLEFIHENF
ncbi:hypothetical protein [Enterococcus wangshanyuanii]|uniref:Excisionase n=1 Tax=Enterococcus wangshanyuanii TaxID=2005703 RepID=A0ABQ1PVQ4_9ENTE|nr:hypothetical protein [Enterococcus wangshanyuanii]GGD04888.1 hypothetical protein GCM10011573_37980 [Enterococcus wangshanyuanii]